MCIDGHRANDQALGNLRVGQALSYEAQHLSLSPREPVSLLSFPICGVLG